MQQLATAPNLIYLPAERLHPIVAMVLNSVTSVHTRRAYQRALNDFITWHVATPGMDGLTKATVAAHITHLRETGTSASSINQRLAAIHKLAYEAADNGLIEDSVAQAIGRVKGVREEGQRMGTWLTLAQAQSLLDAPNVKTLRGLRDRAILAVLLGCGLRREEVAALTVAHIQQREARWVVVNLRGKGSKRRSVPMASTYKVAIDAWLNASGVTEGALFRKLVQDQATEKPLRPTVVRDVVAKYGRGIGFPALAPHDLRRTFAKLAYRGGAQLKQLQLSLGHASVETTELYLGLEQELGVAPSDLVGLRIGE